jgi:hypothetical protein
MQCPKCLSDDVIRSRRRFHERFILPVLRANVYRCRDCKRRFWVGVQWGGIILGVLVVAVTSAVITAMVVVRNRQELRPREYTPAPVVGRRTRTGRPLPKGLPPLSSLPTYVPGANNTTPVEKLDNSPVPADHPGR